jgi:TRAP-type C4-dicarboxylate transport system substrate-binding protein
MPRPLAQVFHRHVCLARSGRSDRRLVLASPVALADGADAAQTVTLKASHRFPGGKGDVCDEMVQMIARAVAAAKVGLEIKVFPGSSLVKAQEQ